MIEQTPLLLYLSTISPRYYAGSIELRDTAAAWLAYIPQTFPHYTQHTIEHSSELIVQLSHLLFHGDDPDHPFIDLSGVEAYILAAASLLHDAGMVASDQDRIAILASPDWQEWTTSGSAANRWLAIQQLRATPSNQPPDQVNFLADIQTRYLLAEFIRKHHHLRTAHLLKGHPAFFDQFSFHDPILHRTIADVCMSHGLDAWQIQDQDMYPTRRHIQGEQANVRLLALLLRLADLLDTRSDRACPLLLNASSPLPRESIAHWSQYQRFTHQLTTPEVIELTAECDDPEEHRYILDWYNWIVAETGNARMLAQGFLRHATWRPPRAQVTTPNATLVVRPSPQAAYIPHDWSFRLNQDEVIRDLVNDLHEPPLGFLRELIQNSLDATRCKLYFDLQAQAESLPSAPSDAPEEIRSRYILRVELSDLEWTNPLSSHTETRQVLTIADAGIGMDSHIITDFLLQIGRSFYTSEEFSRQFPFTPTSRFGIGFLSVFAVSDDITVDTWKPSSPSSSPPLRLRLTGPRGYILVEKSTRAQAGTTVRVLLRNPLPKGHLTRFLKELCLMVEFPISVCESGHEFEIRAEDPSSFARETPDAIDTSRTYFTRAFPVDLPGIEGQIYVLACRTALGESWAEASAAQKVIERHPGASQHPFPPPVACYHGLNTLAPPSLGPTWSRGPISPRLDYRLPHAVPDLPRRNLRRSFASTSPRVTGVESIIESLLNTHLAWTPLALAPYRWKYIQRLIRDVELPAYWATCIGSLRAYVRAVETPLSLQDVLAQDAFTTLLSAAPSTQASPPLNDFDSDLLTFDSQDFPFISNSCHSKMFLERYPGRVRLLPSGTLAVDWLHSPELRPPLSTTSDRPLHALSLPYPSTAVGIEIHETTNMIDECVLLNSANPFVAWLLDAIDACNSRQHGLRPDQSIRLADLTYFAVRYEHRINGLLSYVARWRELPDLPASLHPPDVAEQDFRPQRRHLMWLTQPSPDGF